MNEGKVNFSNSRIKKVIKKLKTALVFDWKSKMTYDTSVQKDIIKSMKELCKIIGVFDYTIKNEKENVKDELFVVDTNSGERINLVDIDSLDRRIRSAIDKNVKITCVRILALANKSAHLFQGEIEKLQDKVFSLTGDKNVVFGKKPLDYFKNSFRQNHINVKDLYKLERIEDFEKVIKNLKDIKNNKNPKHEFISKKKEILNLLGIPFDNPKDFHDEEAKKDINDKINFLLSDMSMLELSYFYKIYCTGHNLLKMQNALFRIKDKYIGIIAQELNKELDDVSYKIVETDGTPGFKHMLILDDEALAYHVEVHMSDFTYNRLINQLNLRDDGVSREPAVLNKAIYERMPEEVRKVREALSKNKIIDKGIPRAKMFSRGKDGIDDGDSEYYEKPPISGDKPNLDGPGGLEEDFSFDIVDLEKGTSLIEDFLIQNGYENEVEDNRALLANEYYPLITTYEMVCSNYYKIYKSFNRRDKISFLIYSIDYLSNGDNFDKELLKNIDTNDYYDKYINSIGRLLIYKDLYKYYYYMNIYDKNNINNDLDKFIDFIVSHGIDKGNSNDFGYGGDNGGGRKI